MKVGGHIIVDDCDWISVAKAVAYFANYPCYEIVGGPPARRGPGLKGKALRAVAEGGLGSMLPRRLYDSYVRRRFPSCLALRKVAPDTRNWDWYQPF